MSTNGLWDSLAHLAGNRLSGHEKVWVMGVYGLLQAWIKTEATVITQNTIKVDNQQEMTIRPKYFFRQRQSPYIVAVCCCKAGPLKEPDPKS